MCSIFAWHFCTNWCVFAKIDAALQKSPPLFTFAFAKIGVGLQKSLTCFAKIGALLQKKVRVCKNLCHVLQNRCAFVKIGVRIARIDATFCKNRWWGLDQASTTRTLDLPSHPNYGWITHWLSLRKHFLSLHKTSYFGWKLSSFIIWVGFLGKSNKKVGFRRVSKHEFLSSPCAKVGCRNENEPSLKLCWRNASMQLLWSVLKIPKCKL